MAGPCAVESREQLMETARCVKREGARVLRGGAFKPRTSPYSFQGLGLPALELLRRGARRVRPAGHQRGRRPDRRARLRRARRHPPGRRPQHARTSSCSRRSARASAPVLLKRGLSRDDRGVAAGGRVHPLGRQPERDPLRARHPHLRDRHPQHARPLGGARPALAGRTCRSSSTRATAPGIAPWLRRWPWPAPPSAPTA